MSAPDVFERLFECNEGLDSFRVALKGYLGQGYLGIAKMYLEVLEQLWDLLLVFTI